MHIQTGEYIMYTAKKATSTAPPFPSITTRPLSPGQSVKPHDRLTDVYGRKLTGAEKPALKADTVAAWKRKFAKRYAERFNTALRRAIPDRELNNAVSMTGMNDTALVDDYASLFELCRRDLALFVSYAARLKSDGRDPRADLQAIIESEVKTKP